MEGVSEASSKIGPDGAVRPPTVSIYQNAEHVAGILQQIYGQPLITEESRETTADRLDSTGSAQKGQAGLTVEASVPIVGGVAASLGGDRTGSSSSSSTSGQKSLQNFVYSQAYYLYLIRNWLRDHQQLRQVASVTDVSQLSAGDFVEYQAAFSANELNAILDILSPDLVAAITHHQVRTRGLQRFEGFDDWEAVQRFALENLERAQAHSDVARAIADAVRVDFRSQKTREYYGRISSGDQAVTAVTICDAQHFVVEDEDRLLDGLFTVLGKVTSPAEEDVPVLKRNKVLDRIKPEAVDAIFGMIRQAVSDQADRFETPTPTGVLDPSELNADDMFDVALSSRIQGTSFRVVPIAIYV